jgi:hypothetical protein
MTSVSKKDPTYEITELTAENRAAWKEYEREQIGDSNYMQRWGYPREAFYDQKSYDDNCWYISKEDYLTGDAYGNVDKESVEKYKKALKERKQHKALHFAALSYEERSLHYSGTLGCSLPPKQKPLVRWTTVDISELLTTDLQLYKFLKSDFKYL